MKELNTRRMRLEPLEESHATSLNWALCLRSRKRYVGYAHATLHPDGHASIAYVLFRNAWGHGYVREAAAALIGYLREDWATTEIATVGASDLRSILFLEALGTNAGPVLLNAQLP